MKLIPVLKHHSWHQNENSILREKLLQVDLSPWVAYAVDEGAALKFLNFSDPDNKTAELEFARKTALENLKEAGTEMQKQHLDGENIVMVAGSEYTCEKILDKTFLDWLHFELRSERIIIGIPCRGFLCAVSDKGNLKFKMTALMKKYSQDAKAEPISENVFLSVDGKVLAMAGLEKNTDGSPKSPR